MSDNEGDIGATTVISKEPKVILGVKDSVGWTYTGAVPVIVPSFKDILGAVGVTGNDISGIVSNTISEYIGGTNVSILPTSEKSTLTSEREIGWINVPGAV